MHRPTVRRHADPRFGVTQVPLAQYTAIMRLVSFGPPGREQPGVLVGNSVVDLCACDTSIPASVREILGNNCIDHVADIARSAPDAQRLPLREVRIGPPVTNPSKIICLGRNYRDHAAEQNQSPPDFPLLFSKGPNVLCGTGDTVAWPRSVQQLDFEVELAFVVGRRGLHIPLESAWNHVAGYTVFLDLSARDLQYREKQWFRGKSFDGAGPCGPTLVLRDEVPNPHSLSISLELDGEIMQSSCTGEMTFTIDYLVHHISQTMTLEPGDIVATGTPPGVGAFRDPPRFLHPGNRLRASIESVGTLTCVIGE